MVLHEPFTSTRKTRNSTLDRVYMESPSQLLNPEDTADPSSTPIISGPVVEPKVIYEYNAATAEWAPFAHNPKPDTSPSAESTHAPYLHQTPSPFTFALVTYNVDFMYDYIDERLRTILSYLQTNTVAPLLSLSPPMHTVILLQEVHSRAIPTLLAHPMVRALYCVTDTHGRDWSAHYGIVTLIPRALATNVRSVFRTPFVGSEMGRSALYVDIEVSQRGDDKTASDAAETDSERTIRIANVHLESLRGHADKLRVEQLASVASFLRKPGVYGGVVAGDMNPIGPLDDAAPEQLGLVDAWVVSRRENGAWLVKGRKKMERKREGHTWGYQPPSRFAPRRMDKVLLAGNLAAKDVEVIGVDLMTESIEEEHERTWASDHYGVMARIALVY